MYEIPRHEQYDLGLSRREEVRCAADFGHALRALLSGAKPDNSLLREVGLAARQRARLAEPPSGSVTIPTAAKMWVDLARRDATTAGTGGYLVATENVSFIELLRNRMVAFQMGAVRLSGLVGSVTIPKQTVGATPYWLATEATGITEGNQTFAQLPLTPRTVGAYTQISRLLRLQSSPDAESLILSDLAQQVAVAVDLAVLAGTGTEQPTGIINTASIGTVSGTTFTYPTILEFQTDVASANALTSTCGYVATPTIAGLAMARPTFAGGSNALWTGSMLNGMVGGFKAMSSPQVPTGGMLFGDWASVVVGEWGVLELSINPYDDFSKGITGLRAMYSVDIGVRDAGAWSWGAAMT
jgi:HK97 family phage major capsid protein